MEVIVRQQKVNYIKTGFKIIIIIIMMLISFPSKMGWVSGKAPWRIWQILMIESWHQPSFYWCKFLSKEIIERETLVIILKSSWHPPILLDWIMVLTKARRCLREYY